MDELEKMKSGTYSYELNVSSFPQGKAGDDLIKRLNAACIDGRMVDPFGPVAALAEAHATIARQQAMLDRALESNGDLMIEKARLEAALRQIRDREYPYPQFSWAMGIAALALLGDEHAALSPVAPDQGEG